MTDCSGSGPLGLAPPFINVPQEVLPPSGAPKKGLSSFPWDPCLESQLMGCTIRKLEAQSSPQGEASAAVEEWLHIW